MTISIISLFKTYLKLYLDRTIYLREFDLFIINVVKILKSHKIYEIIINKYDEKIRFINYKQASFVNSGIGYGLIHIYRKIELEDNTILFEKIYLVESLAYKKIKYFYDHIYPDLHSLENKNKIVVPPLKFIKKGKKLSIFYQKFVPLENVNRKEQYDFSIKYYKIYSSLNIKKKFTDIPSYHDFRKNDFYRAFKNIVMKQFNETSLYDRVCIFFNEVEEQIKCTEMIFQHGDMHIENIYKNNYLVDWDQSGFYPMGYDLGLIFAQRIHYLNLQNSVDEINEFIFSNAKYFVEKKDYFLVKYFTILFLNFKNKNYDIKPIFNDLICSKINI